MRYASNLTIADCKDYTVAEIRNPWDTAKVLHSYILLPDTAQMPEYLPEGTVVRTPLRRSVVYSSVHTTLIDELGAADAISGVCDAQYIHTPALVKGLEDGSVADCGSSMAPNLEQIIARGTDAVLLSPYENNNGYGQLDRIGIPIVECADYMETSPLARAEWMKFYGRLYGCEAVADSMFAATEQEYLRLKGLTAEVAHRPQVLMDLIYSQVWHQPAGESTMGIFLTDAGGAPVAQDISRTGSVAFTPEEVLYRAKNADFWLLRYAQSVPLTRAQMVKDNEIYGQFAPLIKGQVYGCDTQEVPFYEETPYHPDRLLASLIVLLHPELSAQVPDAPVYFSKLN